MPLVSFFGVFLLAIIMMVSWVFSRRFPTKNIRSKSHHLSSSIALDQLFVVKPTRRRTQPQQEVTMTGAELRDVDDIR